MSAETLREAAAIVRERGWTQGAYVDDDGRVCIEGAICEALGGPRPAVVPFAPFVDADEELRAVIGYVSPVEWNDAPERTADEVIAALEAAAARLSRPGGRPRP